MITQEGFIPLDIPVPPMLEESLGYPGGLLSPSQGLARYVAFYWTQGGDEGAFHDGRISKIKINNDIYLAFVRHQAVAPHLHPYGLGGCDYEADYWLVLDREERQLYVAPVEVAYLFLIQQWGVPPVQASLVEVTSEEELTQLLSNFMDANSWTETASMITQEQATRLLGAEQVTRETLITWLDNLN